MKRCHKCNLEYPDESRFCKKCGTPLVLNKEDSTNVQPQPIDSQGNWSLADEAKAKLSEKMIHEALSICKEIEEKGSNDSLIQIYIGINNVLEGKFSAASAIFENIVYHEKDIHHSRFNLYSAFSLLKTGQEQSFVKARFKLVNFELLKSHYYDRDEQTASELLQYLVNDAIDNTVLSTNSIRNELNLDAISRTISERQSYFNSGNYEILAECWFNLSEKANHLRHPRMALQYAETAATLVPTESKYQDQYNKIEGRIEKRRKRNRIIAATTSFSFIAVILAVVFFNIRNNKLENRDWVKDNLRGKVESITETSYSIDYSSNEIKKGNKMGTSTIAYNKKGFKTESNSYYSNGEQETIRTFENGKLIEENYYNYDGRLMSKKSFKYDNKGNLIEVNRHDRNDSIRVSKANEYDKKGNLIEEINYDSDGNVSERINYRYDSRGNLIEQLKYDVYRNQTYEDTYQYDIKGNMTEQNTFHSNGNLFYKYVYEYDDKGNMIKYNGYDPDLGPQDGQSWDYEYDDRGNWIKKTFEVYPPEYSNITEREISYY